MSWWFLLPLTLGLESNRSLESAAGRSSLAHKIKLLHIGPAALKADLMAVAVGLSLIRFACWIFIA
jgi:hypothetical protein